MEGTVYGGIDSDRILRRAPVMSDLARTAIRGGSSWEVSGERIRRDSNPPSLGAIALNRFSERLDRLMTGR
ncbi:MAG TPA: hypothetical protein VF572_05615 [Candidatus Saccharimonadales bacterium]|jgi:hypothetical protein